MKKILLIISVFTMVVACKNNSQSTNTNDSIAEKPLDDIKKSEVPDADGLLIYPIEHASLILDWNGSTIYIDPVGGKEWYSEYNSPSLILITDIHGDHLNIPTLESVITENTRIIAPQAVFDQLPEVLQKKTRVLKNGEAIADSEIMIEAIPMYNLRKEALQFHPKGRGNGYVLDNNKKRLYISGDTEDISEMRELKDIDMAFICMNLPYTMTVDKAAEAVLDFKPKSVYPYHYRGTDGLSDVEKFKSLIESKDSNIKVVQLDWYPQEQ